MKSDRWTQSCPTLETAHLPGKAGLPGLPVPYNLKARVSPRWLEWAGINHAPKITL